MTSISGEARQHFENSLYLPLLITILEHDVRLIEKLPFKLRRPYIAVVEDALKRIRADLKRTTVYMTRHHMRLVRVDITAYTYYNGLSIEHAKYTSGDLRTKAEEILGGYLAKS